MALAPPRRDKSVATFDLYVGLTDLRAAGAHTQWFAVSRVILHPTYQLWHPVGGDVALVQLQSPIEFSDAVRPVCLPPPSLLLDGGAVCWVTGWGLVSPLGEDGAGARGAGARGPRSAGGTGGRRRAKAASVKGWESPRVRDGGSWRGLAAVATIHADRQ